jgi:hypothetical protein
LNTRSGSLKADKNKKNQELLEAITQICKFRMITVRSDNGSSMLRAINNRSDNVSPQC